MDETERARRLEIIQRSRRLVEELDAEPRRHDIFAGRAPEVRRRQLPDPPLPGPEDKLDTAPSPDWSAIDRRIDELFARQRQEFHKDLNKALAAIADALVQLDVMAEELQKLKAIEQRRLEHEQRGVVGLPPLPRRVN
jgi:hypothetical protein